MKFVSSQEVIVFRLRMTVTQENDTNINHSRDWGSDRIVEIQKGSDIGLGFSIIGGKVCIMKTLIAF